MLVFQSNCLELQDESKFHDAKCEHEFLHDLRANVFLVFRVVFFQKVDRVRSLG